MGSIGAYIFRTTLGAFLVVLVSLTAIIWVTHALREFDLVTTQGQNVLVFLGITSLTIPLLVLVIAPLALVIAVSHVLNKLSTDSEIIVMNSAGMSPWRLFRPFFAMAVLVSLLVAAISVYLAPQALRQLRHWITEVRADIVTNIVQPGRFTIIEQGLTFHIRARQPNGQLLDVLLDDQRNERERITLLAERGYIAKNEHGSFLVLENGSLQRHEAGRRDPEIVRFADNYFDLSQFATGPQTIVYSMRERYLWELLWPDPNDPAFKAQQGRARAELHDRILAPLYPFAFVMIAYVFLGAPRTTRESRTWSILGVIGGVVFVRIAGFVGIVLGMQTPAMLALGYIVIFAACAPCYFGISRGVIIEPPSVLLNLTNMIAERWLRRAAAAG
ncbi:MAG TPA: LPS export ABC transporter permease LptF [Xanthobacteraceae bacterium]|nr:LPS export ABC transporter permease LptF [Xanthobacteraceae bacterium]